MLRQSRTGVPSKLMIFKRVPICLILLTRERSQYLDFCWLTRMRILDIHIRNANTNTCNIMYLNNVKLYKAITATTKFKKFLTSITTPEISLTFYRFMNKLTIKVDIRSLNEMAQVIRNYKVLIVGQTNKKKIYIQKERKKAILTYRSLFK